AVEKYKTDLRKSHWRQKANKIRSEVTLSKCLLELSTDDFMNAFEYGYEVEPEFNVGDWVVVTFKLHTRSYGKTFKITDKKESCSIGDKYCFDLDGEGVVYANELRHATPEEIAEEKERRMDEKLDGLLLDLNNDEKARLQKILSNEKKKPNF